MVERSRRGKGKHKRRAELLGSHQRCWLWGRVLVGETLRAGRWRILELFLADDLPSEQKRIATRRAAELNVPTTIESRDALKRRCRSSEHQGYVARMSPFPYATLIDVPESLAATSLVVILDSIQDPYNFGAILRSAEVFGADAVFVGERQQAEVSSLVARSSAGAVNRVPIIRVPGLVPLVEMLRQRAVSIFGTSEHAESRSWDVPFDRPTAIVIGNEGAGIGPELFAACDRVIRIPHQGDIGSLNAAAAAAVLCYEVRRQQASNDRTDTPRVTKAHGAGLTSN
jgi:23S rRNA (guanosine2251-2'-O)-methyltransferase